MRGRIRIKSSTYIRLSKYVDFLPKKVSKWPMVMRYDSYQWSKMTTSLVIRGKRGRNEKARVRYSPVRQSKSDSKMG